MMTVTVLTENAVRRRALKAEHGLSLWIEQDDLKFLFDMGQSTVYLENAAILGIDVRTADYIIISHGHYDHGNGFQYFPHQGLDVWPPCHVHPDAFADRLAQSASGNQRSVGLDWRPADRQGLTERMVWTQQEADLSEQVRLHTITEKPSESVSPGFLIRRSDGLQKDYFLDEQMLISRQPEGLVIVCGCCHPGFLQMMRQVSELYPGEPVHAIMGGFHLNAATPEKIESIVSFLDSFSWNYLVPMHCTGRVAWCHLRDAFGEKCLLAQTGDTLRF